MFVKQLALVGLVAGGALLMWPASASAAAAPVATVSTGGGDLNVRTGPSTSYSRVATIRNGTALAITCQVTGMVITGHVRQTGAWDRLSNGRYVSDAFVAWQPARPAVPACAAPKPPTTATATVNAGDTALNVREGPGTAYRIVGTLGNGTAVSVACQVNGQYVVGTVARTGYWDRLSNGRYVSDAYIAWRPARPAVKWCDQQPPTLPPSQADFIARAVEPARASMREFRVPASVTIAQAILESGWGRSELTRVDHNYFGIKCFGTPGPIAIACRSYATHECDGDSCYPTTATFRVYRNAADSFRDHGRFLVVNERYGPAFNYTHDPNRFAVEIHKAGYATSPTYARSLIDLMKQYDLYRYDR